jgi:HK97 family phage major capsid protein
MKKMKHLMALAAIILLAATHVALGGSVVVGVAIVALWQLAQFAMSKRSGMAFNTVLTPEQVKEFEGIMKELKEVGAYVPGLKELAATEGGFAALKKLPELLKGQGARVDELQGDIKKLRKQLAIQTSSTGVRWVGNVPFVTDECARGLSAITIVEAKKIGALKALCRDESRHDGLIGKACEILGVEQKTAMTSADNIPALVAYMPQIVELVFRWGAARQYATVFPLGAGTVNLPRLKAGEDDFGYLGVGRAGGAGQAVPEKRVSAELVAFAANKAGGLIRIPMEVEEDTFIALGQFLARYIARQFAKLEDNTLFLGDGTATYANQTGIGKYCANNTDYLLKLAAGKTSPADVTLDDLRNLRAKVSAAIIGNMAANGQTSAAYYMHPTWEPHLSKLNKYPNFVVFKNENNNPTLDGWPIRWVGPLQSFTTDARPETYNVVFGDLSYWYMGERGQTRIEASKDYFFNTDELALRALEAIDINEMVVDAVATLQTGAAA